ncbi:DCMP deaminase [Colletotrichum sojae]|uniref:Deoxycytidylate deaminase n=1 Tax=Colletotrichum sojae TaxID=2175907 RepID=A0A8H6J4N1_9PEZI|nr:DCMP deaminase [Colletotrichum sojae]
MLIGICGGICSGKKTVAQYLVEHHGFQLLRLDSPSASAPRDSPRNETPVFNGSLERDSEEELEPTPEPELHIAPVPSTWNENVERQSQQSQSQSQSPALSQVQGFISKRAGKKKKSKEQCYNCKSYGHVRANCALPEQERAITSNNAGGVNGHGHGHGHGHSHSHGNFSAAVSEPATVANGNNSFYQPAQSSSELTFSSVESLLDYVTARWQSRFVTTDVHNEPILDVLATRPFFMLVSVDAPLTVRHARFRALHDPHCTLESFALASDAHLYDPHTGLQPLISRATVRLLNTSSSLAHLYATLGKLQLADPGRLRPNWDAYFMSLATLASLRSNCMKRRVGAVLVGRERRVISTGYNGTPRGLRNCSEGGCPRCNAAGNTSGVDLATCLCIHAEENALLEAGRERIREGAVLYCDTCPCLTCSIKICQVGIGEVVYAQGYSMDSETAAVFRQAGVKLRQYIPPPNGLIHLENLKKMDIHGT